MQQHLEDRMVAAVVLWCSMIILATTGHAENRNVEGDYQMSPFALDSGDLYIAAPSTDFQTVYSQAISSHGGEWIRLKFSEITLDGRQYWPIDTSSEEEALGGGSTLVGSSPQLGSGLLNPNGNEEITRAQPAFLRITSASNPDHIQILDARNIHAWRGTSAYFEGSEVIVEIVAGASRSASRITMEEIYMGTSEEFRGFDDLDCDAINPPDDRFNASHPAIGKTIPHCTAWIVDDGIKNSIISAGHCEVDQDDNPGNLIEVHFNVPPSGRLSAPQDQYVIDRNSMQYQNENHTNDLLIPKFGRDWAYFGTWPNIDPDTYEPYYPSDRQGAALQIDWDPQPGDYVTAWGTGPDRNGRRSLSARPATPITGLHDNNWAIYLWTFSKGGDSGGPLINTSGMASGIHSGCLDLLFSQHKTATSFHNPRLQDALAEPKGEAAPEAPTPLYPGGTPKFSGDYSTTIQADPSLIGLPVWRYGYFRDPNKPIYLQFTEFGDEVGTLDANGEFTFTENKRCGTYHEYFTITRYGKHRNATVYNVACSAISEPQEGASFECGDSMHIAWSGTNVQNYDISLIRGGNFVDSVDEVEEDGSYSWTVPNLMTSDDYQIRIRYYNGGTANRYTYSREFTIHECSDPGVTAYRGTSNYQVGDTASLTLTTNPPVPNSPVYRYRPQGLDQGQWVHIGTTDNGGSFYNHWLVDYHACNRSYEEYFSVGGVTGPFSNTLTYDISCNGQGVNASRNFSGSSPLYWVGEYAELTITTTPPWPQQPVYRYRTQGLEAGQWVMIGTTDHNGTLVNGGTLVDGYCGRYSGERFRVGSTSGPEAPEHFTYEVVGCP